jgi:hypothetical protein
MIIDGVLEILDMDEKLVPNFQNIHSEALVICKENGAILDLASSDVSVFCIAPSQEVAQKVADVYNSTAEVDSTRPNSYWVG